MKMLNKVFETKTRRSSKRAVRENYDYPKAAQYTYEDVLAAIGFEDIGGEIELWIDETFSISYSSNAGGSIYRDETVERANLSFFDVLKYLESEGILIP